MGLVGCDYEMAEPCTYKLWTQQPFLLGGNFIKLKENWKEFEKIVLENGIEKLYHFTDLENIASIKENGGLYSWDYCERNNITINRPGGNKMSRSLDKSKNLENFVRLTFQKKPPLVYTLKKLERIKNPISLLVDPLVIYWENTQFSDENAAANTANIGGDLFNFNLISLDKAMRSYNPLQDIDDKPFFQAEILVEEHIPIKFITKKIRLNI